MTKLLNIRKLTFRTPCPIGKPVLLKKLGSGSNAIVYSAQVGKKFVLVKRISFHSTEVFMKTKEYSLKVIRNKPIKNLKHIIFDPSDAPCTPFAYGYIELNCDNANKMIVSSSYINEAMVGSLISDLPFFCKTLTAYSGFRHGHILMDYAGKPLDEYMENLNLDETLSIIQQVMIGLMWAQDKYKFKHHDLHIGNVFLSEKTVFPLEHELPNKEKITLKSNKYYVQIGDYGFASATDPDTNIRYGRCDMHLNSSGTKYWGKWSNKLEGNEGYDILLFLGFFYDEMENSKIRKILKDLYLTMKQKTRISKSHLRPLSNSTIKPYDVLTFIEKHFKD